MRVQVEQPKRPLRRALRHVPLDEVVSNLAGLGVPGLVLLVVVETSGYAGAAAVAAALAALGPGGVVGGAVTLVLVGLVTRGVAEHGFGVVLQRVLDELFADGESKETLLEQVDGYPVSRRLKAVVREHIAALPDERSTSVEVDSVVEPVPDGYVRQGEDADDAWE